MDSKYFIAETISGKLYSRRSTRLGSARANFRVTSYIYLPRFFVSFSARLRPRGSAMNSSLV